MMHKAVEILGWLVLAAAILGGAVYLFLRYCVAPIFDRMS